MEMMEMIGFSLWLRWESGRCNIGSWIHGKQLCEHRMLSKVCVGSKELSAQHSTREGWLSNQSPSLAPPGNPANKSCLLEEQKKKKNLFQSSLFFLCGCLSLVTAVHHVEKSLWRAFLRGQTV